MNNYQKSIQLLQSDDFVKKIDGMEAVEDIINVFKENGVDLTEDEIMELNSAMISIASEDGELLSEETLKDVAGGGLTLTKIVAAVKFGNKASTWWIKQEKRLYARLGLKW